jgi:hypothetical protein
VTSINVQAAFQKFERERVRVPQDEIDAAKLVHPQIAGFYEQALKAVDKTKVVGSFARKTQAAHLKDIDELIVIDDPDGWWRASAERALNRVAEIASGCQLIYSAEPRVRAVRLRLRDYPFFIDIVPAIRPEKGSGLWLARRQPDEGLDDWTLENPEGQLMAATSKNLACAGSYIPGVRIIKFWNQGVNKPLHSYHAESIMWHALGGPSAYPDAVLAFFEAAAKALAPGRHVSDPGNPSKAVDDRLEPQERAHALAVVSDTLVLVRRAIALDGDAALEAWASIMGPAFPAPSTSADGLRQAFTAGGAAAAGAGIRVSAGRPVIRPRSWRR